LSASTIRRARADDAPAVAALTDAAYAKYLPRLGRKPLPMLDDHAARIAGGGIFLFEDGGTLLGLISLVEEPDAVLIYSVAVALSGQGRGVGRRLIAFAEHRTRDLGRSTLRLYTNVLMTENQAIYRHLGFVETERREENGRYTVYMAKAV
jgi:ribosomal protein S18 acetylase RimI-like enzyme